jgi:hypothetical protein
MQNGAEALSGALAAGWSVEVDVRACGGVLVLAHDPPEPGRPYFALDGLCTMVERFPEAEVFVDVKEPATVPAVVTALAGHGLLGRSWLFDFELCGADPTEALRADPGARCLARVSDRGEGTGGALPSWARGVLLDQWDSDWVDAKVLAGWHAAGMRAFVISPELQGRTLDLAWAKRCGLADGLVTDFPHLLGALQRGQPELHPADPWWRP